MTKHIKYPKGVAVIRGNDKAIQMCIDNLKLMSNVEYCDFRNIDFLKYIKECKPELTDDEIQYYYEQGDYNDMVYRLYVKDVCNIIKHNAVDVLIVNNDKYIERLMTQNNIWSRNIINLKGISYFINLISRISDQKINLVE